MARTCVRIVMLATFLFGCGLQQETRFWIARPASPDGRFWEVYHGGSWRDVEIDGVRPPSSLKPSLLRAGNWFIFAGMVDTAVFHTREVPVFHLRAWNIVPPVRRLIAEGTPPDTTGLPWLTQDDFLTLVDYQRFSLNAAAQVWPRLEALEHPARHASP